MSSVSGVRLPGLATGMDTESMVNAMLGAEKEKIDKLKGEEQIIKWQQEIYREIIGDVKKFTDKYMSVASKDSILNSNSWNTTAITSSNSDVITATGSAGAPNIDYNFNVKKLAETASASTDSIKNTSQSLNELGLNGKVEFKLKFGSGEDQITETITLESTDTVASMIEKINKASDGNVKASFSEMTGKFTLETRSTGENSTLEVVGDDGKSPSKALDFLKLQAKDGTELKENSIIKGSNSEIEVKDASGNLIRTLKEESNSFTIDGIRYNVNATGESRITSKTDTTKVVENMKSFIEDYNKILDKVYKLVGEKDNREFEPLTEEQKKDMSDDEIKKWEEKAKEGILRNDRELSKFVDDLHKVMFGSDENITFLASIGITGHPDPTKKGQLSLDEEKFKIALETKGDEIYKKLAGNSDSIFENVRSNINRYVGSSSSIFAEKAGIDNTSSETNNYFTEKLKKQADIIKELTRKMNRKEDSLYAKFANMEKTMNKLNAQMQQFFQA